MSVGAVVGDSIGYELGRRLGRPWLLRRGERLGFRREHIEAVDAFFSRHGGKAVLLGVAGRRAAELAEVFDLVEGDYCFRDHSPTLFSPLFHLIRNFM